MKILVLSPTCPLPANNGSRIRIFNFIKRLSEENDVTLMMQADLSGYRHEEKACLENFCEEVITGPPMKSKFMAFVGWCFSDLPYRHAKVIDQGFGGQVINEIKGGKYDVVFCNFLDMAHYLLGAGGVGGGSLFVLDQHNWDETWFKSFLSGGSIPLRVFGKINLSRLKRCQDKYYSLFDLCLSVSDDDKKQTEKGLLNPPRVMVARNGVDLEYFFPSRESRDRNLMLFCGSMDVQMNQRAVYYFLDKIFPLIKEKLKDAHFVIVGRSPPSKIRRLGERSDITVTGTVNDVRPYYRKAAVLVAPFEYGGGTKLKIAEAMAMKVPVVSTSVGCHGMEVSDGEHLYIADDPIEFAMRTIEVARDYPEQMVENALGFIHRYYSWDMIVSEVCHVMEEMLSQKRKKSANVGDG